jgi:transposase-like protein
MANGNICIGQSIQKASNNQEPRFINVDTVDKGRGTPTPFINLKNGAYLPALDQLGADQTGSETTQLRLVKYLNNIVELRTHRAIKRLVNPAMGFGSFNTALAFLERL